MADISRPFQRTPNTQTASWFLDLKDSGKLELNPPYQRRSVWTYNYKQFFIDSIVRNYPTQAIFLDLAIEPDQPSVYRVLDGKQRLTTLIDFTADAFPAPESLDDFRVAGQYYSDFPREIKSLVLRYLFIVETVTDASTAELNQAFDRLNRNVSRLNKQELRHAQFGGVFIEKMEKLANHSFWEEVGLVTTARMRRMLDVEYVSEFYVVCLDGIHDGKDYLDLIYAQYDEDIPDEERVDRRFRATREYLTSLNAELVLSSTRFRNVADFYALWAAIGAPDQKLSELLKPDKAAVALTSFQQELETQDSKRSRDYLLAARQGSNKASNRSLRASLLRDVLRGTGAV